MGPDPAARKRQNRNPLRPNLPKRKRHRPAAGTPEQLGFDVQEGPEPLRYVGEVFRTYILAERGDELCIIDKHAAHERQLFEKLAANYGDVPGQLLLEPVVVELSARKSRRCWKISCWKTPGWRSTTLAETVFCALCLRMWSRAAPRIYSWSWPTLLQGQPRCPERKDRVGAPLHLLPRGHQGGDKTSPQELMALAEKILSGEVPPFCPMAVPASSN